MKTRRILVTLVGAILAINASAWQIRYGAGYYDILSENDKTVTLTSGEIKYTDEFVIPDVVVFNNVTYKVTEISAGAFYGCDKLTSLVVGSNITKLSYKYTATCTRLKKVTLKCSEYIKTVHNPSGAVNRVFGDQVEEYVIGSNVEQIPSYLFYECSKVKKITLGSGVKSIAKYSFWGLSELTSIEIPSNVKTVDSYAFDSCPAMKTVTIDSEAFLSQDFSTTFSCKMYFGAQVEKYVIGKNVKSIGKNAFYGCSNLKSVTLNNPDVVAQTFTTKSTISSIFGAQVQEYILSDNFTEIGDCTFYNCANLQKVTLGKNVKSLGNKAFEGCIELRNVVLTKNITEIGDSTFYNCGKITEIALPATLTKIGTDAFYGCNNLTKVTLANVESMCKIEYANLAANPISIAKHFYFSDSNAEVTKIAIPNTIDNVNDYVFAGCSSVTSISFPSSVTSIGDYACYECNSIKNVFIPNGVESIGKFAFNHCGNLVGVTIGTGLKTIGKSTFAATALEWIHIDAVVPPVCEGDIVSNAAYSYVYLEVPNESYKTADIWEKFLDISLTGSDTVAVDEISTDSDDVVPVAYYDLQGNQYAEPRQGVNIVRYSNGTAKKILVK